MYTPLKMSIRDLNKNIIKQFVKSDLYLMFFDPKTLFTRFAQVIVQ